MENNRIAGMLNGDLVEQLKEYFRTTPKDQQKKDWEEIVEKFGGNQKQPDTFEDELDREAKRFLLHNGSIINNLHREDAINSYIKEAFKSGARWMKEKMTD